MTCYLYALVDPAMPSRVRYVGITTNLANRAHVHAVRRRIVSPALAAWKDGLLSAGRRPMLRVLDAFPTIEAAREREWRLIRRWRRRGACDLNAERGGALAWALMCEAKRTKAPRRAPPKCNESATNSNFQTSAAS